MVSVVYLVIEGQVGTFILTSIQPSFVFTWVCFCVVFFFGFAVVVGVFFGEGSIKGNAPPYFLVLF